MSLTIAHIGGSLFSPSSIRWVAPLSVAFANLPFARPPPGSKVVVYSAEDQTARREFSRRRNPLSPAVSPRVSFAAASSW